MVTFLSHWLFNKKQNSTYSQCCRSKSEWTSMTFFLSSGIIDDSGLDANLAQWFCGRNKTCHRGRMSPSMSSFWYLLPNHKGTCVKAGYRTPFSVPTVLSKLQWKQLLLDTAQRSESQVFPPAIAGSLWGPAGITRVICLAAKKCIMCIVFRAYPESWTLYIIHCICFKYKIYSLI